VPYLTSSSSQEEAQYNRRGNEIHWNSSWQACRTPNHQSRGERGCQSEGMGREAQEPPETRIHDAVITATVLSFELSWGRDRGRYGILNMGRFV
jgi:hypothetical protein